MQYGLTVDLSGRISRLRAGPISSEATWRTDFRRPRDAAARGAYFYSQTDAGPITRAVAFRDGFEAWAIRTDGTEKLYTGKPVSAAYAAARDMPMIQRAFKYCSAERVITAALGESFAPMLVPMRIAAPAFAE